MHINKAWFRGILVTLVMIISLLYALHQLEAPLILDESKDQQIPQTLPKQIGSLKIKPVVQSKLSPPIAHVVNNNTMEDGSVQTPEEVLAVAEPSEEGFKKMETMADKVGGLVAVTFAELGYSDEALRAQAELMKKLESKGYLEVKSGTLVDISREASQVTSHVGKPEAPMSAKDAKLTFTPTPLAESSLFKEGKYLGGKTTGSLVNDRWSGIAHYLEFADLGTVRLVEYESGPGGHTKFVTPEGLNERVNGNPATYEVSVEPNGAGQVVLDWTNGNHFYEMTVSSRNTVETDQSIRKRLLELANSLPQPMSKK